MVINGILINQFKWIPMKQDTVEMPNMHRSTYSLAETFDIGIDNRHSSIQTV